MTTTVVVGVDGSSASKSALAWAVDEARAHRAGVKVVHAWQVPAVAFAGYGGSVLPLVEIEDLEKHAEETARETVADVVGAGLDVPVETVVVRGHAAHALVDASRDAGLLVVGSEGHGAFAGMLLGSVSAHVVRHAACPVVVVRPGWTAE